LFSIVCLQAQARTLVVGHGQAYNSIKKAIRDAQNGDTVLIKKGLYYVNNAVITKSITVIGEEYPVLHGADKYEIFTLSGNNITVKGFHLTNSGYSSMNDFAAIKIVDANNVLVENNRITNAYFGVHLANTSHCIVRNNYFKGLTKSEQTTGNGIHLWKCNNALIEENEIHGHRDGIYFEFVTHSVIRNNFSEGNIRYGLHFMFSNDDEYIGNTFQKNGAGVAVMYSKKVTMRNNTFSNNWGPSAYGLLLKDINDSKILHNTFYQNTVGIQMEGANRIEVQQNTFKENGWAAKVQANCNENNFLTNNFLGNTFDVATNGNLVLNVFSGNYWDKYEGYDMNKDGIGDVAYHPVSMYSMIIEQNPNSLMLLRSFMVSLLDKAEKAIPSLTPENLKDEKPMMKKIKL
jgi:nitrous oxidase accessory protein